MERVEAGLKRGALSSRRGPDGVQQPRRRARAPRLVLLVRDEAVVGVVVGHGEDFRARVLVDELLAVDARETEEASGMARSCRPRVEAESGAGGGAVVERRSRRPARVVDGTRARSGRRAVAGGGRPRRGEEERVEVEVVGAKAHWGSEQEGGWRGRVQEETLPMEHGVGVP